MSRLTKTIAPILRQHGLYVRLVEGVKGETTALIVVNPSFPQWGRVFIDHEGFIGWDH